MQLAWKASAFAVEMESDRVEADIVIPSMEVTSHRLRLALEGRIPGEVTPGGGRLTPSWEVGVRFDEGDAEVENTNNGAEIGLGLDYSNPRNGWQLRARGRYLVANAEDGFDEWRASLSARYDPGVQGRGVTFTLDPTWRSNGTSGNRIGLDFSNALGEWSRRGLRLGLSGWQSVSGSGRVEVTGGIEF